MHWFLIAIAIWAFIFWCIGGCPGLGSLLFIAGIALLGGNIVVLLISYAPEIDKFFQDPIGHVTVMSIACIGIVYGLLATVRALWRVIREL